MKKTLIVLAAIVLLSMPKTASAARSDTWWLGIFVPGLGEFSNRGWKEFQVDELCIGAICFPFYISSIVDAYNGATDKTIRFDFWGKPSTKR